MPTPLTAAAAALAAAASSSTMCPDPYAIQEGARFHSDIVCDRNHFNAFKDTLNRAARHQELKAQGTVAHVPNETTSYCPTDPGAFYHHQQDSISTTGLDTMWIVENKSSHAVVISYLKTDGTETSARNPAVTNPVEDESTQLQPGQWMALHTYQGHAFQARELLADGSAGRVLLQHRVGLIPVGNNIPTELLADCPLDDHEPVKDQTRDPQYARTPPAQGRPCHTLDIAFRNVAGCPLHAYYVSPSIHDDASCQESFKFHLGRETVDVPDFMWDWTSATKYEGTFVGHAFQFRLAHALAAWSQLVQVAPTQITDCPEKQVAVAIGVGGQAEAIAVPRMEPLFHDVGSL